MLLCLIIFSWIIYIVFLSIVDNMINVCDKYVVCLFMLKYNLKSNDFWKYYWYKIIYRMVSWNMLNIKFINLIDLMKWNKNFY